MNALLIALIVIVALGVLWIATWREAEETPENFRRDPDFGSFIAILPPVSPAPPRKRTAAVAKPQQTASAAPTPDNSSDFLNPLNPLNPLSPLCPYGVFSSPQNHDSPSAPLTPEVDNSPAPYSEPSSYSTPSHDSSPSSYDSSPSYDSGSSSSFDSGSSSFTSGDRCG